MKKNVPITLAQINCICQKCQRAKRRVGVVPALCQSQFGKGASNGDSVWAITGRADNVAGTPFFHLGVLTNTRFLHRSIPKGITFIWLNSLKYKIYI